MNPNGRKFHHVTRDPEERSSLREGVDGTGSRERRQRAPILLPADSEREGGALRTRPSRPFWGRAPRRGSGCARTVCGRVVTRPGRARFR